MKKISQREAQRLKKRVQHLEGILKRQHNHWSSEWPGGVEIARFQDTGNLVRVEIRTARLLHHAVVATVSDGGVVRLFGVPLFLEK